MLSVKIYSFHKISYSKALNIITFSFPALHGVMGCSQKCFKLEWQCHQLLFGFLAKAHFPQVSHQSCLPANDKGDNAMILWVVHRFPGIYWKTPAWRSCDEGCMTSHYLKWDPLAPNDIVRITQYIRGGTFPICHI